MKTVLISIFDSNMVRNILRTDVLNVLTQDSSIGEIVLLVHPSKLDEYTKEFARGKVILDVYPSNLPSRAELVWWFLLRHSIHTKNVRAKIRELKYTSSGSWIFRTIKSAAACVSFYITYIPLIDWILRWITRFVHRSELFAPVITKYHPDLVILPTIFAHNDIRLLKYCVTHTIPTIGMIKSWDNLIGKDPLLIWPDRLIVHNEIVRDLAWNMHRFPSSRIFISGLPQMDRYADPNILLSPAEFYARYGLDPHKRLIVYGAVGRLISYHEPDIIRYLAETVAALPEPSQLLVRLHPAYPSSEETFLNLDAVIVRPGTSGAERNPLRFDFEFHNEEVRELASTLAYADVVIQSGSTLAIDAACFDTPIVSLGFDGYIENEKQERSTRRLLIKDHFQKILDTDGTRAVYSHTELVQTIKDYMADRSLDHAGRERIVREQCYLLDGKAGERVGRYILDYLKEKLVLYSYEKNY